MNKILIIMIFGMILLIGIGTSFVLVNSQINFDKDTKEMLTSIGITKPLIENCIKINDNTCKANVYEKGGINKDIIITTKYCEEYKIEYYDGICLNFIYSEEQGDCISWTEESETICSEYEIIQVQGDCIEYEKLNRITNECKIWKVLTQQEIETKMINKTEILLNKISDIQKGRENIREELTNEISLEIK